MRYKNDQPVEFIRECFDYDLEGFLIWRDCPYLKHIKRPDKIGKIASIVSKKYRYIILGRRYKAARLIFVHQRGYWPENEVDHEDRNSLNDRITNLRDATHSQNCMNQSIRSDNTSGYPNVSRDLERDKWYVRFWKDGKRVFAQRFDIDKFDEACAKADEMRDFYYGEFG